jgi:hypothetical protein
MASMFPCCNRTLLLSAAACALFVSQTARADYRFPGGSEVVGAENGNNNLFVNDIQNQGYDTSASPLDSQSADAITDSGGLDTNSSFGDGGSILAADTFSADTLPDFSSADGAVSTTLTAGGSVDTKAPPVPQVPEPATLALVGAVLCGIGIRRRGPK